MAFQIPPWLNPPNWAGIMESAARIGLGRRSQESSDLESAGRLNLAQQSQHDSVSEAGDRLRLAYSQLASQEKQASDNAKARLAQQSAAMQLRQKQADDLSSYRSQMVQNAAERLGKTSTPFAPTSTTVNGRDLIQLSPNRWSDVTASPPHPGAFKPNPVDLKQLDLVSKNIAQMEKALGDATDPAEKNQLGQALQGARAQMEQLRSKFTGPTASPAAALLAGPGATSTGTAAAAASPFKEGQILKNKKDGKSYRVVNGVPVPMDGASTSAGDDLTGDTGDQGAE